MIGRAHHVVFDCREPERLAAFYSNLFGLPITFVSDDWVVIARDAHSSGYAFQLAPEHIAPRWPDPDYPQQMHLDVMVEDLDEAAVAVIALGARRLTGGDNVYADPAGHPFCLIPLPEWVATSSTESAR